MSFEPFYLEGSKVTRATVVLYKILSIEFHAGITRDASRLFESLRGLPRYAAWPDIVSRPRFPFVLRFGRTIWSQNWTCRSSVIYWVSHYQLVPNKDVLWKVRKIGHSLPFWELSPLINSFSNVVNLLSSFFLRSPSRRSSSFFSNLIYLFFTRQRKKKAKKNFEKMNFLPEWRATATYCFNQSQLWLLLDLIGPLPEGRRLFGPTVLKSR